MNLDPTKGRDSADALARVDPGWAWGRYEPATGWDRKLAAHLFRRAGFGATWAELEKAVARGPHATIDELLHAPAANGDFAQEFDNYQAAAAHSGDGIAYDAWWLRRLTESPWPLLEKMTLFWHGRFPLRSAATGDLKQWHTHVSLLREKAFADFPSLLDALAGDVAMYTGLRGEQNRMAQPNVRFARPWLEAFTVGAEVASSQDVSNLARAWTGWFVYSGKLRFVEREHDSEAKTILGSQGNFGRDDALRLLAVHPATALNLARALFRAFISESGSPPEQLLVPLAKRLQAKGTLADVLDTMLRSNLLFSDYALGQKIKSPVELVVGFVRIVGGVMPAAGVAAELVNLGQRLDEPPTVHGWSSGLDWLNTITTAARLRLCDSILQGSGGFGKGLDPTKITEGSGSRAGAERARLLVDLLLGGSLPDTAAERLVAQATSSPESLKNLTRAIVAQPEFQLN